MIKKEDDKLRAYIKSNKDKLNTEKAPALIWENISAELDKEIPTSKTQIPWKWISGAIILIIGVGALGFYLGNNQQEASMQNLAEPVENEILEFAAIPDYNETQQYFTTQVSEVWNQVKELQYDETLEADLHQLDLIDKELRAELQEAEGIYKEHVLQAMIQNQQTKLDLLLNVLRELENSSPTNSINYEII